MKAEVPGFILPLVTHWTSEGPIPKSMLHDCPGSLQQESCLVGPLRVLLIPGVPTWSFSNHVPRLLLVMHLQLSMLCRMETNLSFNQRYSCSGICTFLCYYNKIPRLSTLFFLFCHQELNAGLQACQTGATLLTDFPRPAEYFIKCKINVKFVRIKWSQLCAPKRYK